MASLAGPVSNTLGEDIAPLVSAAAERHGLDPVHLLALLKAESGLNPLAERWGSATRAAQDAIDRWDWLGLQIIINAQWPDIGFGYSQSIVLYHHLGDRMSSVINCLAVREAVFSDPGRDVGRAALKLAGCFRHWSCDGTALSAMVVYNAGSDRRGDAAWMRDWAGNVASYRRELAWAEQYREDDMDKERIRQLLNTAWGIAVLLDGLKSPYGQELREAVIGVKEEVGLQ